MRSLGHASATQMAHDSIPFGDEGAGLKARLDGSALNQRREADPGSAPDAVGDDNAARQLGQNSSPGFWISVSQPIQRRALATAGRRPHVNAGRLMRALLFGISPTDPMTYVAVVIGLSVVALLACWHP